MKRFGQISLIALVIAVLASTVPIAGTPTPVTHAQEPPSIAQLDKNGNGMVEKEEAIAALNSYLVYSQADKALAIVMVNGYLLQKTTAQLQAQLQELRRTNPPFKPSPHLTVSPQWGELGTLVSIEGSFFAPYMVTLTIGGLFWRRTTTTPSGSFTFQAYIAMGALEEGFQEIKATDDKGNSATTTFRVGSLKPPPHLIVSPQAGKAGTLVSIEGSSFAGVMVNLTIGGLSWGQVVCNPSGSFTQQFRIPALEAGSQEIKATDDKGNSATTTFTVTPLNFFINNPYEYYGSPNVIWHKGQIHVHSNESADNSNLWASSSSPYDVEVSYRNWGYDFICLTDHNRATEAPTIPGILHILSAEDGMSGDCHLLALGIDPSGIRDPLSPYYCMCPNCLCAIYETNANCGDFQNRINYIIYQDKALAVLAHPAENLGTSYEAARDARGLTGLELTSDSDVRNYWDPLLALRRTLWGFASDDAHEMGGSEFNTGFILVNTPSSDANQEDIIKNIRAGNFLACTRPNTSLVRPPIFTININPLDGTITVKTTYYDGTSLPNVAFIGKDSTGVVAVLSSGRLSESAHEASYRCTGTETYVRVEVMDMYGGTTYSQPLFITPAGGWVELYEHADFQGKELMIDNVGMNSKSYEDFSVKNLEFDNMASSARWFLPSGYRYVLFADANYGTVTVHPPLYLEGRGDSNGLPVNALPDFQHVLINGVVFNDKASSGRFEYFDYINNVWLPVSQR